MESTHQSQLARQEFSHILKNGSWVLSIRPRCCDKRKRKSNRYKVHAGYSTTCHCHFDVVNRNLRSTTYEWRSHLPRRWSSSHACSSSLSLSLRQPVPLIVHQHPITPCTQSRFALARKPKQRLIRYRNNSVLEVASLGHRNERGQQVPRTKRACDLLLEVLTA